METSRLSSKGQVVIPKAVRAALQATPGAQLAFDITGDKAVVYVLRKKKRTRLEDGYGVLKYNGKLLPDDFDVASLLEKGEK
ncbi:MAG: AbrB/MazE/SpoVT family DNA-binding domain-containing protein [Nitrosomonadales bacterium]|nr:AbrB/MazE/SpoVT family DNA-binding domain-containing protein [Nitrosomonadales bacterium]